MWANVFASTVILLCGQAKYRPAGIGGTRRLARDIERAVTCRSYDGAAVQRGIAAIRTLFRKPDQFVLNTLLAGQSTSAALYACWILQTRKAAQCWEGNLRSCCPFDYFLGFIAGRLHVRPPAWWENSIRRCHPYQGDELGPNICPGKAPEVSLQNIKVRGTKNTLSISAHPRYQLEVTRDGKTVLWIGSTKRLMPFSPQSLEATNTDTLAAALAEDETYLVLVHINGYSFSLYAVDLQGRITWRSQGWAIRWEFGDGILPAPLVEIVQSRGTIFVFGLVEGQSAFVEGFERRTGRPVLRFATWYFVTDGAAAQ